MTRRSRSISLGLVALLLVACGVPADDDPRPIPESQVPFDLLAPSSTIPATTVPVATAAATVYVVNAQRLVAARRSVIAPLSLGTVLATLIQGPTDAEAGSGLRSAINPQTRVLSAQVSDGTAIVNLSDAFVDIGLQEQILALAQIVYTATSLPGVSSVQLQLNSKTAEVPRGDGSSTKEALRRSDYASLAP